MDELGQNAPKEVLYRRLVRIISEDIRQGRLPVGARLPTEAELQQRFGASRHTVREAMRELREEGLIVSRQGSGSVVARVGDPRRYIYSVTTIDELFYYATTSRLEVQDVSMVVADAGLVRRLNSSPRRNWLRVGGLRFVDGLAEPICHVEVFIHESFAGVADDLESGHEPLYRLIEERYGERIAEVRQTMRAATLTPAMAASLGVEPNAPALEIERVFLTARHKVLEVSFSTHPLARFSYTMVMRQETGADAQQ